MPPAPRTAARPGGARAVSADARGPIGKGFPRLSLLLSGPRARPGPAFAAGVGVLFPPRGAAFAQTAFGCPDPRPCCGQRRVVVGPLRGAHRGASGAVVVQQPGADGFGQLGIGRSPPSAADDDPPTVGGSRRGHFRIVPSGGRTEAGVSVHPAVCSVRRAMRSSGRWRCFRSVVIPCSPIRPVVPNPGEPAGRCPLRTRNDRRSRSEPQACDADRSRRSVLHVRASVGFSARTPPWRPLPGRGGIAAEAARALVSAGASPKEPPCLP
jgi:hypothetical protein